MDRSADVVTDAAKEASIDSAADVVSDVPIEKAPATASWSVGAAAMCTAAGAGCMDLGAVGGYQIVASGSCAGASSLQLWFPGGASPIAAGAYAVKAATGILDVVAMPAGMVGVSVTRDDATAGHLQYWGRAGTVTVAAAGAGRRVTFSSVSLKEQTSGATSTLGADVTCP
ncbi:MAG TPA: hypothetical protein VHJ20_02100 [Polyangia bacterium]|nr:hypothetical protein [Polyangia bacterium]